MIIEIAVIIGLFLDLYLTHSFLLIYQEKFPKKDYTAVETNPLIRSFVRRHGIGEGILYSGAIILCILLLLLGLLPENWKYFLAGVYYMMVTFHLTNFLAMKRMGNNQDLKGGKK